MRAFRPRRENGERGAAALIVGITMSLLLVVGAFAVDLGMQRVLRRDLQAMADLVALDMARLLGDAKFNEDKSRWQHAFADSIGRNLNRGDDVPKISTQQNQEVLRATVDGEPYLFTAVPGEVDPETGDFDPVDWPNSAQDVLTAIRVTATSEVGFAFGGVTGIGAGGASRSAIATNSTPVACFSVGTDLVDLNTADNALVQALERFVGIDLVDVSTTAVGPGGILSLKNLSVPLVDLAAALDVGTVDELLSTTQPITVGQLLTATAEVLNDRGDALSLDAALILDELATHAEFATPELLISDILSISPDSGSALTAQLAVLDIMNALVYVASEHAVGIEVPLSIPGVGDVLADVEIIEIPKITCARPGQTPPAQAESAQVRITAEIDLPATGSLLTGLLTGVNNLLEDLLGGLLGTQQERVEPGSQSTKITVAVTSAHSTAVLRSPGGIHCSKAGEGVSLDVTSSLAEVGLSIDTAYTLQRRTRPSILSPWGDWQTLEEVDETLIGLAAGLGDDTPYGVDLTFPPPPSTELPSHTRNTPLAVDLELTTSQRNLVTDMIGDLAAPVIDLLLEPLLALLNAGLLPAVDTVLGLLGIDLGNTTVKAHGRPTCSHQLVG